MSEHLQRRCISCGKREHKRDLLRIVWCDGGLVWDRNHRIRGRGAYCHPSRVCVSKLEHVRLLERAFRTKGALRSREQVSELAAELLRNIG